VTHGLALKCLAGESAIEGAGRAGERHSGVKPEAYNRAVRFVFEPWPPRKSRTERAISERAASRRVGYIRDPAHAHLRAASARAVLSTTRP
jgi:hypothetical protein